jgi:hypothetical protein
MGPAMDHFREVATERVAERVAQVPPVTQAKEPRVPRPPVLHRAAEPQVRREESQAAPPRIIGRNTPEPDQPRPLQESRTQNDSAPNAPTTARSLRPEITQEPADIQVPVSRHVVAENVQPRQEPIRPAVQIDVPVAVPSVAQQFPAIAPERREQPDRTERRAPTIKAEPQIYNREFPITRAPAPYTQPAVLQNEIAAPGIHVTIGKVTVQATLPAASVHVPAQVPTHSRPRLTLERYLDRRGGRP